MWQSFRNVLFEGEEVNFELEGSLSFVGMKLVLVIIRVKYRIMTSYIQYKIQYKYNVHYKFRHSGLLEVVWKVINSHPAKAPYMAPSIIG